MNSVRSPAPAAAFFNTNSKNNVFVQAANSMVNAANTVTNTVANAANTMANTVVNATNTMANTVTNTMGNTMSNSASKPSGGPSMSQIMIIILLIFIIVLVSVFWRQVQEGFRVMYQKLRELFGAKKEAPRGEPDEDVTKTPDAPQHESHEKKIVEKILPGRQQVFNINKNGYTYYDAEPLCKALGADLATYEQVKQAYAQGADWCNYGWVKGQMAVYPTQTDTWQQLQNGEESQRNACGQPGVNGGFFDNPDLKFGVNCYGEKPAQSEHDATIITSGDGAPLTPGGLEFEKKVSKYRGDANNIGILPFNKTQWSN